MLFQILIISIILIGIAFAGFAIKMFFDRTAEFKKSCSSVDPVTGKPYGCSCGNADGGESCVNKPQPS